MRAAQVVAVVLGVLCTPVVLILAGPAWLIVTYMVIATVVIAGTRVAVAAQRTSTGTDGSASSVEASGGTTASPGPLLAVGGAEELAPTTTHTDEELCWAWRRSYAQLQRTTDPEGLARLAAQRQGYLDELEHRHPTRFTAWIDSGARAASDPHPYITCRRTP